MNKKHKIKPGDSLLAILKQYPGVTVDEVKAINPGLNPNKIAPGQVILIPQKDLLGDVSKIKTKPGEVKSEADLERVITEAAAAHGIPYKLFRGLVAVESVGDTKAKSEHGAQGLTQIMPIVLKSLNVKDPTDIKQNLAAGAQWLKIAKSEADKLKGVEAFAGFGFDKYWELALMIYHGGMRSVQLWLNIGAPLDLSTLSADNKKKVGSFGTRTLQYPQKILAAMSAKPKLSNF